MHEMALAEGVLQLIEQSASREKFSKVLAVWLEVGELAGGRTDLSIPVRDDLDAVAPLDLGAEPGDEHVGVGVDDHAGSGRRTGAASASRGSWPRSSSST